MSESLIVDWLTHCYESRPRQCFIHLHRSDMSESELSRIAFFDNLHRVSTFHNYIGTVIYTLTLESEVSFVYFSITIVLVVIV